MQQFMKDFPFVLSFLVGTILFLMTFGRDLTLKFLLLVLLSMVVLNKDKITSLLGKVTFKTN